MAVRIFSENPISFLLILKDYQDLIKKVFEEYSVIFILLIDF